MWLKTLREPVAWEAHRQGHTGIDRMTMRVRADWFWPGMTADIRRLVNACEAATPLSTATLFPTRTGTGCRQADPGKWYPWTYSGR